MAWFWSNYCPSAADRADPLAALLRADLRGPPPTHLMPSEPDDRHNRGSAVMERPVLARGKVEALVFLRIPVFS
jgi:acetyl esterase/lipase